MTTRKVSKRKNANPGKLLSNIVKPVGKLPNLNITINDIGSNVVLSESDTGENAARKVTITNKTPFIIHMDVKNEITTMNPNDTAKFSILDIFVMLTGKDEFGNDLVRCGFFVSYEFKENLDIVINDTNEIGVVIV